MLDCFFLELELQKMFSVISASTTAKPSMDLIERVITSEVEHLMDIGAKTISEALHKALAQRQRMVINELNEALNVEGRTGGASPQPSRLEPLLRTIPEYALDNYTKYGSYFREYTHIQLLISIRVFQSFIEQETRFLLKKRAQKISDDFFKALVQLSKLQTVEITTRLEMAAEQRLHNPDNRSSDSGDCQGCSMIKASDIQSQAQPINRHGLFSPSSPIPIPIRHTPRYQCDMQVGW